MLQDTHILTQHGRYEVFAQRQEVCFRDGTIVVLHPVREDGYTSTFLRALIMPAAGVFIFDLRMLAPELDDELRGAPARDVPGTVYYTLRQHFTSGLEFHRAVGQCYCEAWALDITSRPARPMRELLELGAIAPACLPRLAMQGVAQ